MAKIKNSSSKKNIDPSPVELHHEAIPQNEAPIIPWFNFDQCWNATVKNGTPFLLNACKEHLRSLGWLDKPEKWIDGMMHFGIKIEK